MFHHRTRASSMRSIDPRGPALRPRRRAVTVALVVGAALVASAPSAGAAAPQPSWWSYDRPATSSSRYTQVAAPMRDGVRLGCDLHRPAASNGAALPGRFPSIVYEVTPYTINNVFYLEQGDYFARRGYNAIMCNVRGTGRSGGTYPQMNQPAEQTDAYDLVEWIAAQPYADGKVGQTGESYGGMSSYRAAASGAPSLKAVVPQQSPNDLYLENIYPGGIPTRPLLENWWPGFAGATSLGRVNPLTIFAVQAAHPRRDAFWQQVAIDGVLDRVDVPVLAVGGWVDPLFRSGSLRNYERLVQAGRDDAYLIYGPWTHGEVIDWKGCKFVSFACASMERMPPGVLLAWFDHWVAGRPDAPLPTTKVASYQGPIGTGAGWRESVGLPSDGVAEQTLALRTDSTMATDPGAAAERPYTARPIDGILKTVPMISFNGPALTQDTDLVGRPALDLAFRSSTTEANLHVELRVVARNGSVDTISEGFLRASHRDSHEVPTPLTPRDTYRVTIPLLPVDLRIPAGSKLAVRIGSGDASKLVPVARDVGIAIRTGAGGSALRFQAIPST